MTTIKSAPDTITRHVRIEGDFSGRGFIDWIADRAARLSIDGQVHHVDDTRLELSVTGERVLLDAMEVACSLGPAAARVDDVSVLHEQRPAAAAQRAPRFLTHSEQAPV